PYDRISNSAFSDF
uniref:Lymna-DF-amide 1 n=6 Tax=Lymnaea stagnalis TaxID=6523 RepID=DFAM1_LYMST|nr:RecName: Full=Lymna-DF-amide 1 [Lymnaea stagnalis]AAB26362.1 lymnaDFamide 1=neuropeptide homolog [Lymnaea stagnalis=snails, ganglia, Peptide, 13 aa] [Lymnaea stagnalis]